MAVSLLDIFQKEYKLSTAGIHGIAHAHNVYSIGVKLQKHFGGDLTVIKVFGALHDIGRSCNGPDPLHGLKAANIIASKYAAQLGLNDQQLDTLCEAMQGHPLGLTSADKTIAVCWDADRLDLARLDVFIDEELLSTSVAQNEALFDWAVNLHKEGVFSAQRS